MSNPSSSSYVRVVVVVVVVSIQNTTTLPLHHPSLVLLAFGAHASYDPIASNPPTRDLKVSDPAVRDLTLAELGLAPSSVLHLRFLDDDELNRTSFFFPFPSLLLVMGLLPLIFVSLLPLRLTPSETSPECSDRSSS
jgi:hypothetical protein